MISREPTLERLATAQSLLLEPFGLNEGSLAQALALIAQHHTDDADLYFQTTRHEGWSLEEGIVKSGSFSIDQGVGVRAIAGEKTAFAYSDDLSEASLFDAARTVRTIAAAGQSRRVKVGRAGRMGRVRRRGPHRCGLCPRGGRPPYFRSVGEASASRRRRGLRRGNRRGRRFIATFTG